jgi:hypothetical protein
MSATSSGEPDLWREAGLAGVAALVLFAAAAVCAHRVPLWIPGVAVAAVGVMATLVTLHRVGEAGWVALYALSAALSALGWVLYALVTTPWSWPAVMSLLVLVIVLGGLYPVARGSHRAKAAAARRQAEYERAMAQARKWPDLLAGLGFKGISLADSAETRAGHTHLLRLPLSGKVTLAALAKAAERIEIAAKLRRGSVRFEAAPGDLAHEVLMHVAEKDILALEVPFPGDLGNLTVNRPFPVGVHEDGQVAEVLFREVAALIIGLRGSGKSNLMNVLIAQLARCVDTVIFMIDNKGGRTARPWLQPWIDERSGRPVIDWVATTREESELMLRTVLDGIKARAESMAGGEKVIPSPRIPAVVLLVEEMAIIFGMGTGPRTSLEGTTNTTLSGLGTEIVRLGRSEAIDPVGIAQRGTVTTIGSGDMKSQFGLRFGLGVATEADARLIFPDDTIAASVLPKLKHQGAGIVGGRDSRPAPVKFYRLTPDRIYEIAEECGNRRPAPDPDLEDAFGDAYRTRWSRQARLLRAGAKVVALPTADPPGSGGDDDVFRAIVEGEFGGDEEVHPSRARMLEFLRKRGVQGATRDLLYRTLKEEGLEVRPETLSRWLAAEERDGHVHRASHGRWKYGPGSGQATG